MASKVRSDAYVEFHFIGEEQPLLIASGEKNVHARTVGKYYPTVSPGDFKKIFSEWNNYLSCSPAVHRPGLEFATLDGEQYTIRFESLKVVKFVGI